MAARCYDKVLGVTNPRDDYFACGPDPVGGAASCCYKGHVCLSHGFCAFFGPNAAVNKSGYYLGGCTDPGYSKPGCRSECAQWYSSDAIWSYNDSRSSWSCCGTIQGTAASTCYPPQGPEFQGADSPGALQLVPYASIEPAGTAVPFGNGDALATTTLVASPAAGAEVGSSKTGGKLSDGAIAAVVVGAILALSWAVVGTMVFHHLRRRRRIQRQSQQEGDLKVVRELFAKETVTESELPTPKHPRQAYQLAAGECAELPSPSQ